MKYVIVGGGGFGREVACWALDVIARDGGTIAGFIDDQRKDGPPFPPGIPYLGKIADFSPGADHALLMAIGSPRAKEAVAGKLRARGARFATLRHPSAIVAATAQFGEGTILCPQCILSANTAVGDFVTVNLGSTVDHDVRIGDYSTLAAHVDLTGGVVVGKYVNFGSGARVLPGLQVGDEATVGAGAVVMRTVAPKTTVYGAAAKRL